MFDVKNALSPKFWMALVAIGIALILWRIARGKSGRWLINANALAAIVVLYASAFLDFPGIVAHYNVRHAYEVTGRGVHLDLGYLGELGPASLPALDWYRGRARAVPYAAEVRDRLYLDLEARQRDWRTWTWAGERLIGTLIPPPPPPALRLWKAP